MEILVKAAQFFLSLSILVILHELGHFVLARIFKTRVEKFYLFFDAWFSIFKFKKGDTEYGMGWLPLGGYVKISGMIDESMDKEQLKKPPQPWEFRSKPSWQRLLIMMGGVLVNFLLGLMIYAMVLYTWGESYLPTTNANYGIVVDSLGQEIGLQNGDKILSLDNQYIEDFQELIPTILLNDIKTIQVERDGEKAEVTIPEGTIARLIKEEKLFSLRLPYIPLEITGFAKESPAKEAGLLEGDKIIKIDGIEFAYQDEFLEYRNARKNQQIKVTVLRGNEELDKKIMQDENGMIGVMIQSDAKKMFEFKTLEYSFFASIPAGIDKGVAMFKSYLKQLRLVFQPKTKAYESLGGFITIGKIFPDQWDWEAFWNLTAFLSIILAIMNMLPIPALDGGHVMFLLYEVISGRKPSDKFMEYAQIAGMIIVLSLLIYANGNDIVKLFNK